MQFTLKIARFELGSIFGLLASPPERIVGVPQESPQNGPFPMKFILKTAHFGPGSSFGILAVSFASARATGACQQCPQHGKHNLNRGIHDVAERTFCDNMRFRTTETPSKLRNQ